ncbi:MAG: glycoside hydrolase family 3 N-terminal domain-containing protein [Chitinophagaceae bacterium]
MKSTFIFIAIVWISITSQAQEGILRIHNKIGKTIAYSSRSGIKTISKNGLIFKDLNRNGKLDAYEDWRLSADVRAKDLASQLTIEEIAGLMLYSAHQSVPARPGGYFAGTYDGKPFQEGVNDPSSLTDQQKKFLKEDNLRHVLLTTVPNAGIAAKWNNNIQEFCESVGKGIPANNSSDPRHGTIANAEFNAAAGGLISMWPSSLGFAATFDPAEQLKFSQIMRDEYRAMGITTALSPQVDMATEPRWTRFDGTFGENSSLAAAMAEAYINGLQSSGSPSGESSGWGSKSVNGMVKHWPGGGSGEAGRDGHFANGKYAVYPGNNFEEHLIPFTQGAFKLSGKTKMASAVMPYYTISIDQDIKDHDPVANNYNKYMITDLLRNKYHYDGVICTDWGVTGEHRVLNSFVDGKPWGVEKLTLAQRHYKILMAGVDQYGGNNDMKPILEAYQIGIQEHGESFMRKRMEQSAYRLLRNIFNVGLFEDPYLNPEESSKIVGSPDKMKAGFDTQLKSVVMLKNKKALPLASKTKVYVPKRYVPAGRNFLGMPTPESNDLPVKAELIKKYFDLVENPLDADVALVFIENPKGGNGYSEEDVKKGGNGYVPIPLQFGEYTAIHARETSLAGGDPLESFTNRSYIGKTAISRNSTDLEMVNKTKSLMQNKPVIVCINVSNPMIFSEFEKNTDAILVHFSVQDQALLEIISGKFEPNGLLPMQMPANMETVEKQFEDVAGDMDCHVDSEGHKYDFGFGLNWKGIIKDSRTNRFSRSKK